MAASKAFIPRGIIIILAQNFLREIISLSHSAKTDKKLLILARNLNKILCFMITFCYEIFLPSSPKFNKIFWQKKSKSLTNSPENNPCSPTPSTKQRIKVVSGESRTSHPSSLALYHRATVRFFIKLCSGITGWKFKNCISFPSSKIVAVDADPVEMPHFFGISSGSTLSDNVSVYSFPVI